MRLLACFAFVLTLPLSTVLAQDDEAADDEVADDEVADDEVADDEVADDEVADDSSDDQARIHFESGRQYFDAGSYEDAAREFETAFELSGRPQLLYNLFATNERLNELERAIGYLERYLEQPDLQLPRSALEERLATLRRRVAGESGGTQPAFDEGGSLAPAIIGWSIGAAALVSFGILAALSSSEYSVLEDACGPDMCDDDEVSTLRAFNIVADVSLGVGIAGLVAGTILWIVTPSGTERNVSASAWVAPDTIGGTLGGRF